MAIINRDKDASEQRDWVNVPVGAIATGVTKNLVVIPYPCTLQSVRASAQGVSNAMQVAFEVLRGTGSSGIPIGISNLVLQNRGTSGLQGFSGLAAVGSTLLSFQTGDVLQIVTSVANGNATDLVLQCVLKKIQDIVSLNGSSS